MTLNEVISYLDENAHGDRGVAQLSEWLHELRLLRTEVAILEALRDGFKEDAQKSKAENAKLRELVHDLRMQLSNAYDNKELEEFDERMQELGIEVDDET